MGTKKTEPFCKVDGCKCLWYGGRGYCSIHYFKLRKYGDPLVKNHVGFHSGDKNPSCRPEWRSRLSKLRRGTTTTEETRLKISESMKRRLEEPELRSKWGKKNLGRKISEATKRKIAATRSKRPKKMSSLMHNADSVFSKYIRHVYS